LAGIAVTGRQHYNGTQGQNSPVNHIPYDGSITPATTTREPV
jgi:hypothetical protein